jgi:tetratricopeptide (TPR) repeat protein
MADKAKLLKAAQKHLTKGNLDKAIKVFQQLVEVDPRDHRLVLRLADLQARSGRKKEAINNYEKVAAVYIKDDFTPKAIAVYKTILRLDPELLSAYEKLSELYKTQGLEAEAVSQLDNLFKIYEKKNDEEKQIEVLKLMSSMDAENLGVQVRLGETLAKKGRSQEAAEAFAKAASTLSKRGLHDRASSLFEKITALNPGNIAVRKELCAHYLESGQYPEARKEIEAILEIEPDDPRMELLLGRILFQMGHKGEGETHLARSLELFSSAGELGNVLKEYLFVAQTHLRNDEVDEAEAFYRQISQVTPQDEKALKGLVSVAEKRGDRTGQVNALVDLGKTLAASENLEKATDIFNQVLELDPVNPDAKSYLEGATLPVAPEEAAAELTPEPMEGVEEIFEVEGELEIADDGDLEDVQILAEAELAQDDLDHGEEGEDILEVSDEALEEVDDGIPDIVLDGFDDDVEELEDIEEIEELPGLEDTGGAEAVDELAVDEVSEEFLLETAEEAAGEEPTDVQTTSAAPAAGEMTVDELLVEAEVYERYNLADKVEEILNRAAEQYPGDPRVLRKLADHYIETGSAEAPNAARNLITSLADSGDQDAASQAFSAMSAALPDPSLIADLGTAAAQDQPALPDEETMEISLEDDGLPDIDGVEDLVTEEEVVFEEVTEPEPETPPMDLGTEDVAFEAVEEPEEVPAAAEDDRFAEDMEEADFYLSQGLTDEARRIYNNILGSDPGHSGAASALAGLDGEVPADTAAAAPEVPEAPEAVPAAPESPAVDDGVALGDAREFKSKLIVEDSAPEDAGGFLDLADELRTELADEIDEAPAPPAAEGPVTFEEVFAEFKKGIAETLGDEEYETHYNLGIAYKDMGLYDDAIREFEVGARDPALAQDSLSLMSMCFMEKKDFESAIKAMNRALESTGGGDRTGLQYQLGGVHEKMGNWQEALASYEAVEASDPAFEGISEALTRARASLDSGSDLVEEMPDADSDLDDMLSDLIKEVEEMAQETETGDDDDLPPATKKNRISYL